MTRLAPTLLGILNITEDSFSDGGRYLAPGAALEKGRALAQSGAAILDIGAASSRPGALPVAPEVEIARLQAVVPALHAEGFTLSVDSFSPPVQRWALAQGVAYLNDVRGFPDATLYPALAASPVKLIVMHAVTGEGPAMAIDVDPDAILPRIEAYFDARLAALMHAGIAKERLILDPGMGFFLGNRTDASLRVLRNIRRLKERYDMPVLVSMSRKSFLRRIAAVSVAEAGPASLAAEIFAARQGADFIRTHDPAALAQALAVWRALEHGDRA